MVTVDAHGGTHTSDQLTVAAVLKFMILAEGVTLTHDAHSALEELAGDRALTPADFASTSGLILALEDDVWVNAPYRDHNPNFVERPPILLDQDHTGFVVRSPQGESRAQVWLPPRMHGRAEVSGRPAEHFVFSHGDRVRLSPIRGCAMRCRFCNIPYEDPYETKPLDAMVESVRLALEDDLQPAQHVLISGGTPAPRDFDYLQEVYRRVLTAFPDVDVDIMMVPLDGLLDLEELRDLGVNELSINLELSDDTAARQLMPQKHAFGWPTYLRFIEEATRVLGEGRVRSMLMVGLEPPESTLAGVQRILDHGGVPVLSPFRPDPATPLRDRRPITAQEMHDVFDAANQMARNADAALGPKCIPCMHNTLTLPDDTGTYLYSKPVLV